MATFSMTETVNLSLTPGGIEPIVNVGQYDVGSRTLKFNLGGYSIPDGAAAEVRGTKPDRTGFTYACDITDGTASIVVQDQMTACAGRVRCELEIRSKDAPAAVIHTARFILKVDKSPLDDTTVISDSELSLLETAGNSARAAAESASAAKASETNASKSAESATQSASAAKTSADTVGESAKVAMASADAAKASETNAATSALAAAESAKDAAFDALGLYVDSDGYMCQALDGEPRN